MVIDAARARSVTISVTRRDDFGVHRARLWLGRQPCPKRLDERGLPEWSLVDRIDQLDLH
jgi:hypothetical protein